MALGEFGIDFSQESGNSASESAMIRSVILAIRCESPGLKGRSRTRDGSGLRMAPVRLAESNCYHEESSQSPAPIGSLKLVSIFCARRISANESRNASVDSAPWFPLTRSTCKPSPQPPVSGE